MTDGRDNGRRPGHKTRPGCSDEKWLDAWCMRGADKPMPYFPCANQYACATQPNVSSSRSEGSLMPKGVVQRPGYGSAFAATRPDSRGAGRPSVSTK